MQLITRIGDQIFFSLIDDLETENQHPCMSGSGDRSGSGGKLTVTYTVVKPGVVSFPFLRSVPFARLFKLRQLSELHRNGPASLWL